MGVSLNFTTLPVRISFALCLVGALLLPACGAVAQDLDLPGWDLFWHDEFDGNSLDTQKWDALNRRDSFNNEKQYYHPDQVAIVDGNLELTAINVPRDGKDYQSGIITSRDLFGPGRFEARVDLPTSQGMWPAFWLNSNHVSWPQGGEIDILENRGSQPNLVSSAYHWQTNPGPCCNQHQFVYDEYSATQGGVPVDFHAGFHTYAAEWDETSIRFYVDDQLHFTVEETPNRPVFETPKNIILNLAVGGFFGGDPDGSTVWPQTMKVDYVRVWQPATDPVDPPLGENLLSNPGFDDNGGSLAGWDDFGNAIPNVLSDDGLANDGTHALKIFGQFNGQTNYSGVSQGVAVTAGDALQAVASTQSPAWDTLAGKTNEVTMKLEFYSEFGGAYQSASFLSEVTQTLHDGSSPANVWRDHSLQAVAPEGAVEARLSFSFEQPGLDNGAIWIDTAGLFLDSTLYGDYDNDGTLGPGDYTAWRDALAAGTTLPNDPTPDAVDASDYVYWSAQFGANNSAASTITAEAVPEPATLLPLIALLLLSSSSRVLRQPHAVGVQ